MVEKNDNKIVGIIKVFKDAEKRDFFLSGKLYMKSLHFFITNGNEQQKDEHEAISMYKHIDTVYGSCKVQFRDENDEYTPVFCTYAVMDSDIKNGMLYINEKMKEFGDYAVLITDAEGFIDNVRHHNPNMDIALIHYMDETDRNTILYNPITWKAANNYKQQKELRFFEPLLSCCDDGTIKEGYPGLITEDNIIRYYTPSCTRMKLFQTEELINGVAVPDEMISASNNNKLIESRFDLSTNEGWMANSFLA